MENIEQYFRYIMSPSSNPKNVVILNYSTRGRLVEIWFGAECTDKFIDVCKHETPVRVEVLQRDPEQFKHWISVGCSVSNISEFDLSFRKFWDTYAYKVGCLRNIQKKWEKLPETDKIMALGFISRMRMHYEQKGYNFPMPETYLNQRRWENLL
jgi:hypothetical protein